MRHSRQAAWLAALLSCAVFGMAQAEQTLVVAGYGGDFEDIIRDQVFPKFSQDHGGVKLVYVGGNSTDSLAKMQAQRSNQQIDVAILDDGPMYQAIALNFCEPIQNLPVQDLYKTARFPGDKAVGLGLVATGIMYNRDYFKKKGWAAPTSWDDLKDPKYKGLLVIPPIDNTYGLQALVEYAKENGGSEKNIDPGFTFFAKEINPNVLVYEPSPGKMTELFSSGQAEIAVWGSGRARSFEATGFPVGFVYPKQGAYALLAAACPVNKPNPNPLAQSFVNYLLTPPVQTLMASKYGYGPVNKTVTAKDDPYVPLPIGERAADLVVMDWNTINQNREQWNTRWTHEVER